MNYLAVYKNTRARQAAGKNTRARQAAGNNLRQQHHSLVGQFQLIADVGVDYFSVVEQPEHRVGKRTVILMFFTILSPV